MAHYIVNFANVPCAFEKNYFALDGYDIPYVSKFNYAVKFLSDFLIAIIRNLKSPTIIAELFTSPYNSVFVS